jgi:uncharacterized membrane protein
MSPALSFLIGLFAGLRSMTAPAVTAWAVHLGRLRIDRPLSLIGSTPSIAIFTVLAILELVVDKLPNTPNRTAPRGLIARILTGGLTGACVAAGAAQRPLVGGVLGALGGVVGCFGGYQARKQLVKALGTRDINIAFVEDLVAIAGSVWVLFR